MNILDENIIASQRQRLRSWRIPVRQIGVDIARKGLQDEEILPFLHHLHRPTFFTRDRGFYRREVCHRQYGLVCLEVRPMGAKIAKSLLADGAGTEEPVFLPPDVLPKLAVDDLPRTHSWKSGCRKTV
jgi:hypothetical protein